MSMKNLPKYFVNLLILTLLNFTVVQQNGANVTVSDQIRIDTEFYFRELSLFPSKRATIEYSIKINTSNIGYHCVKYDKCSICVAIYTTKHDIDLKTHCLNDLFGQLGNEDLHTPLYNRGRPYRSTTCKLDDDDMDLNILHCEGRITVQDYIPRHYWFSFGYHCWELVRRSLRGLLFNFTISGQTNETTCIKIPDADDEFFNCHELYPYTSLPNMIGNPSVGNFDQLLAIAPLMGLLLSSGGRLCYKYARELLCHIIYPECVLIKDRSRVIPPCKTSCSEFLEACSESVTSALRRLNYKGTLFHPKWRSGHKLSRIIDCNYLPSVNDPILCFSRPVTCESPPNASNARIINGINPDKIYQAKSQVKYQCLSETFQMEGTNFSTCQYDGHWDKIPKCKRRDEMSLNPLSFVLPLLLIPMFVFILAHIY